MTLFAELTEFNQSHSPSELVALLIERLETQQEYNKLFDALMLKVRVEMGLSLGNPTTFEGVPEGRQEEFEEQYVAAARKVGLLFVDSGNIPQGWVYLRTIGEQDAVKKAFDDLDLEKVDPELADELLNVALYENAHPIRGLELMLKTRGTCNTITACDQAMAQFSEEDRKAAAQLLINHLYTELQSSLMYAIEQQDEKRPEVVSIRELLLNRDWLFAEGNYHIDVSHLHSVVRFARFLDGNAIELPKARELAEYGAKLAEPFQYPAEAPFEEFYKAHHAFFDVLIDENREQGLVYFQKKVAEATEDRDAAMSAYVLVDLLCRIEQFAAAVPIAEKYLQEIDDPSGFSFSRLCQQAKDFEALKNCAQKNNDPVGFTLGLLEQKS